MGRGVVDIETATATPRSPVSVEIVARSHRLIQDKPQTSGGKDEGLMASELLLAGLLACQHSTFVKVAAKRRVDVAVESIAGDLEFEDGDIARIKVRFILRAPAAVPDASLETLLRLTDKTCTISKALKPPVEATFTRRTA